MTRSGTEAIGFPFRRKTAGWTCPRADPAGFSVRAGFLLARLLACYIGASIFRQNSIFMEKLRFADRQNVDHMTDLGQHNSAEHYFTNSTFISTRNNSDDLSDEIDHRKERKY